MMVDKNEMPAYDTGVIRTPNVGIKDPVVDDLACMTQQPQSDKVKDEKGLSQVPKNLQKNH